MRPEQYPNTNRTCWICQKPLNLSKASGVSVGLGQVLIQHDTCAMALSDAIEAQNSQNAVNEIVRREVVKQIRESGVAPAIDAVRKARGK